MRWLPRSSFTSVVLEAGSRPPPGSRTRAVLSAVGLSERHFQLQVEAEVRTQAIEQVKRKRDFRGHLASYVVANAALWTIWAVSGADTEDLWPAWVSGIWGCFLLLDARNAYGERPISEEEIQREMRRIHRVPLAVQRSESMSAAMEGPGPG